MLSLIHSASFGPIFPLGLKGNLLSLSSAQILLPSLGLKLALGLKALFLVYCYELTPNNAYILLLSLLLKPNQLSYYILSFFGKLNTLNRILKTISMLFSLTKLNIDYYPLYYYSDIFLIKNK